MDRSTFIGGSDAAAVLGMSRWKTPLSVWAEKTGQVEPEDISDRLPVKLGLKLEQTVADLFMEDTGKKVHRVNEMRFHKDHPFLGATLDRRVVGENAILECKTTSAWKAKEWDKEEIPQEYIVQVLHYLAVTGAEKAYVAVLVGNQDFKWKTIERDNNVLKDLIDREVSFWNDFVVPKIMPMGITSYDRGALEALFPQAEEGKTLVLDKEADLLAQTIKQMEGECAGIEKNIELHKNRLRGLLGDASLGESTAFKVFWSNFTQQRFDTQSFKKAEPELYKKYLKESVTRRFDIKRKGSENGKA